MKEGSNGNNNRFDVNSLIGKIIQDRKDQIRAQRYRLSISEEHAVRLNLSKTIVEELEEVIAGNTTEDGRSITLKKSKQTVKSQTNRMNEGQWSIRKVAFLASGIDTHNLAEAIIVLFASGVIEVTDTLAENENPNLEIGNHLSNNSD